MTPLAVPALTRAWAVTLAALMTRSAEVQGENARRGRGESETARTSRAMARLWPGVSPGSPGHLAGPHPALPRPSRHTRWCRVAGLCRGRSSARVLIPGPDHSKLSRHAQLTPSVSLSARPPARSRTQPSGMRGR